IGQKDAMTRMAVVPAHDREVGVVPITDAVNVSPRILGKGEGGQTLVSSLGPNRAHDDRTSRSAISDEHTAHLTSFTLEAVIVDLLLGDLRQSLDWPPGGHQTDPRA